MSMKFLDLATPELSEESLIFSSESTPLILWKKEEATVYFHLSEEELTKKSLQVKSSSHVHTQLFQVQTTKAHLGRGVTWGEIPNAPVHSFYDRLQPYTSGEELNTTLFGLSVSSSEAGQWTAVIELIEEERVIDTLTISFEVLDLALPMQPLFDLELWQYPYTVARYHGIENNQLFQSQHEARVKENLACYQAAGGKTIVTTIVHDPWNHQTYDPYPSLVTWTKKGATMTFDFTAFDQYVKWNLALGIDQKIKCFSLLPWEDQIYYFDETGKQQKEKLVIDSPEWHRVWGQFLMAFVAHLEEKGWFEKTYIAIDERPAEVLTCVLALLKKYPNRQGGVLKLSCAMDYQSFDERLLDQIADLSIGQSHLGDQKAFQQLCAKRRAKGLFTSIYNCVGDYPAMFLYSHPLENQWIIWNAMAYGADGFLRWALDAWVKEPLENASHWYWESGDPFLIYPGGQLSIRYQQMMQALIDVQKYQWLQAENPASVRELTKSLAQWGPLLGKTNAYGAQVAASKENSNQLRQQMATLREHLALGARNYLKESNTWKSIN
ncbi:DUF4091 domain-containing protein [Enterococcus sp. LJL98]